MGLRTPIRRCLVAGVPIAKLGAGPPLVVLAGLSSRTGVDSDRLVRQVVHPVRALAGARTIVVLNRWPGLPEGLTLRAVADRYAEVVAELGAPVDVVGVSTGGSIAQVLAAELPEVVRRLALVSTACRLGPELRPLQAEVARRLRVDDTRGAAAAIAGSMVPAGLRPAARMTGRLLGARLLRGVAARDLRITLEAEDDFDLQHCSGSVRAPTLIVGGGRDRFYPPSLFEETAGLIPGSRLLIRPRRGHVTVVGDRRTAAHLAGFLTAGDSARP